jgi:hypothetical protein
MGELIKLDDRRVKKAKPEASCKADNEFADRLKRVNESIKRIKDLMESLKHDTEKEKP